MRTIDRPSGTSIRLCACVASVAAIIAVASATSSIAELPSVKNRQQLGPVLNWGYWLSSFEAEGVIAAPHDLLVVDNGISANRRFMRERSPGEVARMKRRPDGTARVLLSYLSNGR